MKGKKTYVPHFLIPWRHLLFLEIFLPSQRKEEEEEEEEEQKEEEEETEIQGDPETCSTFPTKIFTNQRGSE